MGVLPRLLIGGDADELGPRAETEMQLVSDTGAETAVALELHLACLNSSCSGNGNLTTATGGCNCGVSDCRGRAGAEELGGDGVNFGTSIWV